MQKVILIFFSLMLLLGGRFLLFYHSVEAPREGEVITLSTTLLTEPKANGTSQSFTLYYKNYTRVTVYTPRFPSLHYGDSFLVTGKVKTKQINSLGVDKTIYSLSYPKITRVENSSNFVVGFSRFIRRNVSQVFHEYLPPPADSLLLGIIFGINEGMSDDFTAALQSGGVLHVIAASGMNVTMVAGALFFLLGTWLRRQPAVAISIIGIAFYAVLSGLQPSIVRASIMGIIVFSASLMGRQNTALITLGLTGYGMLLWKPILLSDVGFQLSFLSTLGILTIKPFFTSLEKRWEGVADITTTLSAQIATLPIMFMTFGQYGLLSVVVNAFVLWTIPILMVLGSVAAILGLIHHVFAMPFLYLSLPFLWFFIWIVTFFGRFNLMITVPFFPWALSIGYYTIVLGLFIWLSRRQEST